MFKTRPLTTLTCGLFLLTGGVETLAQSVPQRKQEAAKQEKADTKARGANSLSADIFENARQIVGFSLGVSRTYEKTPYQRMPGGFSPMGTAFQASAYANLGRRRTKLHLRYGFGYRLYDSRPDFDTGEHYASADFSLPLTRRQSISIYDQFSSSPLWYGGQLSPILTPRDAEAGPSRPGFITELYFDQTRIKRNVLGASWSLGMRGGSLGLFASHSYYEFEGQLSRNVGAVVVGISHSRRLNRWLSLNNSFASHLTGLDPTARDTQIHRLDFGGLDFRLSRSWNLSFTGGVEYAAFADDRRFSESAGAGLGWNASSTTFSIGYHRGFYTAIGIPGLFQSNQFTASLGSRLSARLNLQVSAAYTRGAQFSSGLLENYTGRAGLEFVLLPGLVASISGDYQKQTTRNLVILASSPNRYAVSAGLTFFYPSGRR